jgi:hypothetical protein
MASQTRSTKLPAALAEGAEHRAKKLGYPSWNAYIKGLIRYDLLVQGEHTITLPWAALALDKQDKIDLRLLELTQRGVGQRGQLLSRVMERITKGGGSTQEALLEEK